VKKKNITCVSSYRVMNGNRNGNMKIEMVICKEINNNCKQESWNIPMP
jgi:hypothetical protein